MKKEERILIRDGFLFFNNLYCPEPDTVRVLNEIGKSGARSCNQTFPK